MKLVWLSLLALALLAGGCVSNSRTYAKRIDWGSRIGYCTYAQAVTELGNPDYIRESSDGRVADWILERRPAMSFGFGLGSTSYGRHSATGVGVGTTVSPPPRTEYLRLRFDSKGTLVEWTLGTY